ESLGDRPVHELGAHEHVHGSLTLRVAEDRLPEGKLSLGGHNCGSRGIQIGRTASGRPDAIERSMAKQTASAAKMSFSATTARPRPSTASTKLGIKSPFPIPRYSSLTRSGGRAGSRET